MSEPVAITDLGSVKDYLGRIGAEVRSIRSAFIRQEHANGYWRDLFKVKFYNDGSIEVAPTPLGDDSIWPTEVEEAAIRAEVNGASILKQEHPQLRKEKLAHPIGNVRGLANPSDEPQFIFTDENGGIVMVQRRRQKDGKKWYTPWTYYNDGQWRSLEPEGRLPLWGIHQLQEHERVFLHEGASSAANCLALLELGNHPWQEELSGAAHIGWIGGALNPSRTDWSPLNGPKAGISEVTIVPDNDHEGIEAVGKIAQELRCVTYTMRWGDRFPKGFDLGDKFPPSLFDEGAYTGESLYTHSELATWLTEVEPKKPLRDADGKVVLDKDTSRPKYPKGATAYRMRPHAKQCWVIARQTGEFVQVFKPQERWSIERFNLVARPFSHVERPSSILAREHGLQTMGITYAPGESRMVVSGLGPALNLWTPSQVKPVAGDVGPWEGYLSQLLTHEEERHQLKRWVATRAARPDLRCHWGVLLYTQNTGRGKSTLGDFVMKPLVGEGNYSQIGQLDTNSEFNAWAAEKTLVCVHEVRKGGGWAVEKRLKNIITEPEIIINKKYVPEYVLANWCHILACTNYEDAVKLDAEDRRWFAPTLNEEGWGREEWGRFRQWLRAGGLNHIMAWAHEWGDYVQPGEHAPPSSRHQDIVEGSLTPAQEDAVLVAHQMAASEKPLAVGVKMVSRYLRERHPNMDEKLADKPMYIRRAMVSTGLVREVKGFINWAGNRDRVLVNEAAREALGGVLEGGEARKVIDYMMLQEDIGGF